MNQKAIDLAIKEAIKKAKEGYSAQQVPIAGCFVSWESGTEKVVAVGRNQRVLGNPVLHGETSCAASMGRMADTDWSKMVAATTLDPCPMCTGLFEELYQKGMRTLVIGEDKNYQGASARLRRLPGMEVVLLEDQECLQMMENFKKEYPDVWAGDIGQMPADENFRNNFSFDSTKVAKYIAEAKRLAETAAFQKGLPIGAVVVNKQGFIIGAAEDQTKQKDNLVWTSVMGAMNQLGAKLNPREAAIFVTGLEPYRLDYESLGCLEIFDIAWVVLDNMCQNLDEVQTRIGKKKIKII